MYLSADTQHKVLTERFVEWLCIELQISPRSIEVHTQDDIDGVYGLCMDVSEDEFVILVKTKNRTVTDWFVTIAHEMIHVKQHLKENLNHWLHSCSDIPYMQRWWEIEAFGQSGPLVEKFAKGL